MKISHLESILSNNIKAHLRGVSRSWTDNLVGYSGIGKTYLVKYLATENDCVLINVPVSELEPGDLVGSPIPVQIRPNVYIQMYALPNWLPHILVDENNEEVYRTFEDGITRPVIDIDLLGAKVENRKELEKKHGKNWKEKVKGCVILFDEINRAMDDQMKNAIFEFIEKGRLHTYESPWNTHRISTMNPPNKNYYTNEMTNEKAFMRRFTNYILNITVEEWLAWAEKRGINELIRDFIAADPSALMEDEEPIVIKVSRTPAGYEQLSVMMDETDFPTDVNVRREIYYGIIGKDYGKNLSKHEKQRFEKIPKPQDILLDYESIRPFVLEMRDEKNRSDIITMIQNYMLVFLSNEYNAYNIFLEDSHDIQSIKKDVADNFQTFAMDLYPHLKSSFVRKVTDYSHMNLILGHHCQELFDQILIEADEAFENE